MLNVCGPEDPLNFWRSDLRWIVTLNLNKASLLFDLSYLFQFEQKALTDNLAYTVRSQAGITILKLICMLSFHLGGGTFKKIPIHSIQGFHWNPFDGDSLDSFNVSFARVRVHQPSPHFNKGFATRSECLPFQIELVRRDPHSVSDTVSVIHGFRATGSAHTTVNAITKNSSRCIPQQMHVQSAHNSNV